LLLALVSAAILFAFAVLVGILLTDVAEALLNHLLP
jgi:hypothetical protein